MSQMKITIQERRPKKHNKKIRGPTRVSPRIWMKWREKHMTKHWRIDWDNNVIWKRNKINRETIEIQY